MRCLFVAALLPFSALCQDVTFRKTYTIFHTPIGMVMKPMPFVTLGAVVDDKDTIYAFSYQDAQYSFSPNEAGITVTWKCNRERLKEFTDAMEKILEPKYPIGESKIQAGKFEIVKAKLYRRPALVIMNSDDSYFSIMDEQVRKMIAAIAKFQRY